MNMRLVAWNCCRGPIQRKLDALRRLVPDVAVLPESPPPVEPCPRTQWFSAGESKLGILVWTSAPFRATPLARAELPNCVIPLRIDGPLAFNLLAVWTWPAPSYLKALTNALQAYGSLLSSGPTVVMGDFNGNPVFDKPRQRAKWSDAFGQLNASGLVSAYHHAQQVNYGSEPDPTHHYLRKPERPFHIDYCFVPQEWSARGVEAAVPSR